MLDRLLEQGVDGKRGGGWAPKLHGCTYRQGRRRALSACSAPTRSAARHACIRAVSLARAGDTKAGGGESESTTGTGRPPNSPAVHPCRGRRLTRTHPFGSSARNPVPVVATPPVLPLKEKVMRLISRLRRRAQKSPVSRSSSSSSCSSSSAFCWRSPSRRTSASRSAPRKRPPSRTSARPSRPWRRSTRTTAPTLGMAWPRCRRSTRAQTQHHQPRYRATYSICAASGRWHATATGPGGDHRRGRCTTCP